MGLDLDDFGTGYSSLLYLKHFPVDRIKIDRSFVAGLGSDHADTAIVASTIALAHSVGIQVVAEGVETSEQLERLRQLGCDCVQGYLVSRPIELASLRSWLSQHEPRAYTPRRDAVGAVAHAADRRDAAANGRDATANRRDAVADLRDDLADIRDDVASQRDTVADRRELNGAPGADGSAEARVGRDTAAHDREVDADQRLIAERDRRIAGAKRAVEHRASAGDVTTPP